ncbi:D-glycero-beta-D-manno-heptose 1-phosphate adenylyltransferase [Microbacterium sp. BK668]|uniref:D-glycero-beta-D-manno-heptose 1-phosphate adenylyltransferase n=1 Tax=Microbacterium sp. BK668 TaxID=2512118 RepID=UPI0010E7179D|nr:D-glycero-beta-D-manno-heptose 1-phosphate adenylyltransferase [Microbacterium sp. BK668]TDN90695.1 rfaE bifunctional protein kinase chain/domain/rfaE bifunctional protein nucleotidyltransferase chain/domain [Microbacterium sp. BK668]
MTDGMRNASSHGWNGIVEALRAKPPRVTVLGDVMLDRWLRGGVRRLSRESPVPVVDLGGRDDRPGGAANTAMNLAALGARVRLLTVAGEDDDGTLLRGLLDERGVDTSDWVVRPGATTCKTRVVGNDQMIVRIDSATHEELDPTARERWHRALATTAGEVVLACDYGTGLFDDEALRRIADAQPAVLLVDAHDLRRWARLRPDIVFPNAEEASLLAGLDLSADRVGVVSASAPEVLERAGARSAVVTLDRDGTLLLRPDAPPHRTHAIPASDDRTIGAGDTFAAGFTAAYCVGRPLAEASDFGQAAANVAVAHTGTFVCSLEDLVGDRRAPSATRTVDRQRVVAAVAEARERGRVVVFTNGCFDLLHPGHAAHLEQAKAQGDLLVVALNDDASVRRLKGVGRPVSPVGDRARMVEALGCVDYVVVFSDDSPAALLEELRPQLYVKGGDYTAEMLQETAIVEAYGGEVRILDFIPFHSTTRLVERIQAAAGS